MNYSKINNTVGWICFAIALITYVLTLEPSVSFWDCGEFIASALKMQVVHQPGAPLFLMIERFFSIFAFGDKMKIAYFMNLGSAIASAATILFLFWTITALAKKILVKGNEVISSSTLISIMGAGIVGALAYTFSDSFWFSAVEAEVYALSSLFTAIVFWAILKWEAIANEPRADRWLLFIAYIMGLSIGIHLLNLLTIPAIAFVYYFKKTEKPTTAGIFKTFGIGVLILGVIQYGIIQYLVKFGAYFDLFFVNTLGLGFGMGVLFFAILLIGGLVWGIKHSIKHNKKVLNLALLSTTLIIFGYASFAMIIIRAQAKPNLNNSNPDNAFSFLSYLNREQYGDRPLVTGPNYNTIPKYTDEGYPVIDTGGKIYRKGAEKYEVAGVKTTQVYGVTDRFPDSLKRLQKTVLFPRMYSDDERHAVYYKDWMHLNEQDVPSVFDNIGFFASYQVGFMYMRYFAWNFIGRQNEDQGQGSLYEGQWLSGVKPVDAMILGDQSNLPPSIKESTSYNRFFALPLILGILGALWHFNKNAKDGGIIGLLFICTGIAIVIYLNQKPMEPRERDYAYVGSFYAFAIWIGLGALAIKEWVFGKLSAKKTAAIAATVVAIGIAPVLMASQGWDDHNRSNKMVAHDIAVSYMESCAPNAILFTYGDNDTYPLWYIQEVEGVRPDIRLVNLSLFDTDWYINGMRRKVHESEPLPITMKESQYVSGVRDYMRYTDANIQGNVELKELVDFLLQGDNDLPTKNLKLTVNPQDVISTGTLPASKAGDIVPVMEWRFNKGYITKGTLAMFDILAHNNWKRPVYFCSTVPAEQFNGLDRYLYSEGLALRLLPLKIDSLQDPGEPAINLDPMYNHIMNKFKWGKIKTASYLDSQSTDDVSIFNNMFNSLVSGLIKAGRIEDAKKVIKRYDEVMPTKIYSIRMMMGVATRAQNLYILGETQKANDLIKKSAAYIQKELTYLADVTKSKGEIIGGQNGQIGLNYGLLPMAQVAAQYKQMDLAKQLAAQYEALDNRFDNIFSRSRQQQMQEQQMQMMPAPQAKGGQ